MNNSDGSLKEESGGFGALLKTPGGDVVVVSNRGSSHHISVLFHELQGAELGLKMDWKENVHIMHIFIDYMLIYNLLVNPDLQPPWNVLQIWRRIKALKKKFTV